MTVDIKRLTAHLSEGQRDDIANAYKQQAVSETAAFLWCFFLGWMGAHRFFLHQWGQAILRFIIALIAVGIVVVGILTGTAPPIYLLVALPFALVAIIWEIIDLFRIDDEISALNLKLAESLIARAMLADTTVEQQARAKLDEVVHHVAAETAEEEQREQAITEIGAAAEPEAAGAAIYAEADTIAEAERYEATTITEASAAPNAGPNDDQPVEAGTRDWSETEVASSDQVSDVDAPEAGGVEAVAVTEAVTRSHTESGYSVTDSVDTVVNETEAEAEPVEEVVLSADLTPITAAESEAPTWPNLPSMPEPVEAAEAASPVAVTSGGADVSDMGTLDSRTPVADIGTPGAAPIVVSLGDESGPSSGAQVEDATTNPESFIRDSSSSIPVESYIPPIVPIMDTPAPVETPPPAPAEDAPETLAEVAGLATVAAGIATPTEEPVAAPEYGADTDVESGQPSHMLKRIRVTHQIKVNGEVIEETSAEELIDADADPEPVRQRLREQLHRQASARMSELGVPPDQNTP
jgi:TM2 domain-containing membrane protein YozV